MAESPPIRWRIAVEAVCNLFWARLLCLLPMRRWSRWAHLRVLKGESTVDIQQTDVRIVQRHLRAASRRVPWRADCLPQALAAVSMLARRGYTPVLALGARSSAETAKMSAHAWVECAGIVVCGGPIHRSFPTVVRLIRLARR